MESSGPAGSSQPLGSEAWSVVDWAKQSALGERGGRPGIPVCGRFSFGARGGAMLEKKGRGRDRGIDRTLLLPNEELLYHVVC